MNGLQLLHKEMEMDQGLPVMPPDISSLLKTLNDDDIGYTQLAGELEKFPSIVIKIVATANSAWASPVNPITTLRDSCARIGVQAVRSISIALSIAEIFDPTRCPPFDSKVFWVSALLTAEAAHMCAKDSPDVNPDTARLAGLLHNMGLIWLATQKPMETAAAISLKQNDKIDSISKALNEQLGINLYSAGACLASHIELPEAITEAIASSASIPDIDTPLTKNHRKALKLASAVLRVSNEDSKEVIAPQEAPYFEKLSAKLPGIQSVAQALFFY